MTHRGRLTKSIMETYPNWAKQCVERKSFPQETTEGVIKKRLQYLEEKIEEVERNTHHIDNGDWDSAGPF
jgi:hypothetical protein